MQEVIARANDQNRHDFVSVTLTDEKEPYHPREQLEEVYDYLLEVRIDNTRTRNLMRGQEEREFSMQPMELFASFYQEMQGQPLTEQEEHFIETLLDEGGEEL